MNNKSRFIFFFFQGINKREGENNDSDGYWLLNNSGGFPNYTASFFIPIQLQAPRVFASKKRDIFREVSLEKKKHF